MNSSPTQKQSYQVTVKSCNETVKALVVFLSNQWLTRKCERKDIVGDILSFERAKIIEKFTDQ